MSIKTGQFKNYVKSHKIIGFFFLYKQQDIFGTQSNIIGCFFFLWKMLTAKSQLSLHGF